MPGAAYNLILEVAADQHGYVTQEDARRVGVASVTLARMAERGTIERTSQGVYRVPAIPPGQLDQYMEATLWPRGQRGVLSHQTALELHRLSDVNPAKIHLTVSRKHRIQRKIPDLYVIYQEDLAEDEVTAHEGIAVVTPMRAVLECHMSGLGSGLIEQAIADGLRTGIFTAAQAKQLHKRTGTREMIA